MTTDLFSGLGETQREMPTGNVMLRRIRDFDWEATSIGRMDAWPDDLGCVCRTMLSSSMPMSLLIGREGLIVYNDALRSAVGPAADDLLGRPAADALPDVTGFCRRMLARTFEGRSSAFRGLPLMLFRGNVRERAWFDLDFTPIIGAHGRIHGALVVGSETTECAQARIEAAEDALRQSEERFSRAFRLTPVPTVVSTRKELHLLDINDAFVSVFGFTGEEVIGKSGSDLPIWVSAASPRLLQREIAKSGSFRNIEMQLRAKHEEILDCLISAETMIIRGEECLLTTIQDITERRRTEVELIAAIDAVMKDDSWFGRTVIEKLANLRRPGGARRSAAELSDLTGREQEILGLICQGLSDGEIVEALGLTRNTVRNHVARIYGKADVHSRSAAIIWARERGFTGPVRKMPS